MHRILALVFVCLTASVFAADGDFDTSFGTGGAVELALLEPSSAGRTEAVRVHGLAGGQSLALASVSTGINESFAVLSRLAADGSLDATFGSGGKVQIGGGTVQLRPTDMKVTEGGKIVVAGVGISFAGVFVARLEADGTPDAGFGTGGLATGLVLMTFDARLVVQADGGVVVLTTANEPFGGPSEVRLLRFGEDGLLDPAFHATTGISGSVAHQDLALQADGGILVAFVRKEVASSQGGAAGNLPVPSPPGSWIPGVARFTPVGARDNTFNATGEVMLPLLAYRPAMAIAVLFDGRILAASYSDAAGAQAVARILPTGVLDTGFGSGGVALAPAGEVPDLPSAIALLPDGRFVTAGAAKEVDLDFVNASVARYLPDGRLDPNFRGTGRLYEGSLIADARGIAIQPDGKLLVAGSKTVAQVQQAVVARLEGPAASEAVAGSNAAIVMSGASVDLTADVFGVSPTGTVDFRLGGVAIAGCTAVPLVAASATCPARVLSPGAHAITVAYSGDSDDAPALSPTWMQYVLSSGGDVDGDGVPDLLEAGESLDPTRKDNDIFAATERGARLFAMQQFRDLLGIEGDAYSISFWSNAVFTGSWTRAAVIDTFLGLPEFGFVAPVARLYFATFLRVPDNAGLTFNSGLVRNGTVTLAQLADFFAASPEFVSLYGALDNTQFVTLLYGNVLGRAPDPAGLSGWVALLQSGYTRGQVLLGFSDSVEYQAAIANEVFVTMIYSGMLRRAPDPAGFSGWVGYLDAGTFTREQVINGFYLSSEYRARFLP